MTHEQCRCAILAGRHTAATGEHLRACTSCSRLADAMAAIDAELHAPCPSRPRTLQHAVLRRPARAATIAKRGRALVPRPRIVLCAATVVAALLTGVLAFWPGPATDGAVAMTPFTDECDPRPGHGQVVVAGVWTGQERARFVEVLERFERSTGHEATYAYQSPDMASTMRTRLARGCPPDVALLPQPGLLADLARGGQIAALDDVAGAEVRANYDPSWRELATVQTAAAGQMRRRLFGVWFKAADKSTVWYNRALFRAAGVEPPSSWDGLRKVATRLSAHGTTPFAIAGADGWTLTDWFENVYLRTAGPARYKALATHQLAWTDPTVKRALVELAGIFGRTGWIAGGPQGAHATTYPESVRQVFVKPAAAAMVYEGSFTMSAIADAGASVGREAGVFPFPAISGSRSGTVVGGDVAVLFARHAHKPAARALVRFLATPYAAEPWARSGGFISPNRRLAADAYPDPTTRELATALARQPVQFDLSDLQPPAFGATAGQGMWKLFRDFLADPRRVHATAEQLERAATEAWRCERMLRGEC